MLDNCKDFVAANSIEELAEKSTFLEVSYLLIYGELPTINELDSFTSRIKHRTLVHEDIKTILTGFPSTAHPMGVLSSLVTSLAFQSILSKPLVPPCK